MTFVSRVPRMAVAGLLLCGLSTAASADWSDPTGLPTCPETFVRAAMTDACLLPVRNAGFEEGNTGAWTGYDAADSVYGLDLIEPARDGDGNAAVLRRAEMGIRQVVALPANPAGLGGKEATFVTRFRVTSDGQAPVKLHYRVNVTDAEGRSMGRVTEGHITTDGSDYVHAMRHPSRDLPDGGHLAIELIRGDDETQGLAAYVDDVSVVVRDRK